MISIESKTTEKSEIVVAVRDSGVGIPAEDLKKLFKVEEKYTRTGLAGEKGTGFGLSICHEIMQKHGGSIEVESEVGKGTTFYVSFPVVQKIQNSDDSILVVDDEKGVRVLHTKYIKRILPDMNVIEAADGSEALLLAHEHKPKVIISDYAMPGFDGIQLLNSLRKEESTKHLPVIVITGQDSNATVEALKLAGAQEVLHKPVEVSMLEQTLGKFLRLPTLEQ